VIYHGVDVNEFPIGTGDGDYAAFLGRMSPDKGVHIAARAARRAGVPLRIAAKMREPAEFAYFERDVKPLLGGGVQYVGEVGGQAKLELLAQATCLLNPLTWPEPFGMVMIEALACGTPVVATPCGSAPELVVDGVTGFICASEGELADAMRRACGLDRSRCRADVLQRFNAARMAAEHIQLYASAATQPAPALDTATVLPARPGRPYTR
jgi:glycosyltransferase involved in cell wall biosynthesis